MNTNNMRSCTFLKIETFLKIVIFIVAFAISIIPQFSFAQHHDQADDVYLNALNFCHMTEQVLNNYEPEEFAQSNNLLRRPGQKSVFCGQRIIIYGKVLDKNCVPVSDAKVYAWQVGCNAKYPYKPFKSATDPVMYEEKNDGSTFVGHGSTITNNKGEFIFVTVFPKAAHDLGPHINIRVKHDMVGTLNTVLELQGKRVNDPSLNPDLARIIPAAEEAGTDIYEFKVVMPGQSLNYY